MLKNSKIQMLFRSSLAEENELLTASNYFNIIESRSRAQVGNLVVARYSALPYYDELEKDLLYINVKLINSFKQHRYIADLKNWYLDLEDLTPKTWFRPEDVPIHENGSFILKGETNSRKHLWNTHMFAENRDSISNVFCKLLDDSLISTQQIYVRKFEKLKTFTIGLHDLPITNEFRFFVCDGEILSGGFYWSDHVDELEEQPDLNQVPKEFLQKVTKRIGLNARFYVVDVGQKENGDWIVIELNDGQMSGLSCNNPDILYKNLNKILNK